jgi:hypothetical protein
LASIAIQARVRRRGKKMGLVMYSRWGFSTLDRKVETRHPSRANRAYNLQCRGGVLAHSGPPPHRRSRGVRPAPGVYKARHGKWQPPRTALATAGAATSSSSSSARPPPPKKRGQIGSLVTIILRSLPYLQSFLADSLVLAAKGILPFAHIHPYNPR